MNSKNLKDTKGLIFDYGGTLDSGGCHWGKYIWHAWQRCGVPADYATFRDAYVHGERTLARNPIIQPSFTFRDTLSAKLDIELARVAAQQDGFVAADWHDRILDDLYAGVKAETARSRSVLERLKDRYPMVLVSNFYGNIETVLREMHLDGFFDSIVESAVVGVRKPDPRIFTLGVERLSMPAADVTVVGDSYDKDIVPAKAAGCHTVWLKGEAWNDESGACDSSAADAVIDELAQLLRLV